MFERDAVIRKVDGEAVLLLGGGRALLMQLAHPSVARGVAEHSDFAGDPLRRLRRTLEVTATMVFGTSDEATTAAAGLAAVHDRIRGEGYRANDPELLLWVHATLVDTALRVHERFLRPLSADDQRRYYEDSTRLAELIGVPLSRQPATLSEFRHYVRTMCATLEVTDEARRLAAEVLHPRLPWVVEPALELARQVTVGLLPPPLRRQYGLGWDRGREAALLVAGAGSRRLLPLVPAPLRRAVVMFA